VGPALLTIGTLIAIYLGKKAEMATGPLAGRPASAAMQTSPLHAALDFFRSPIFIALCIGLVWSVTDLPDDGPVIETVLRALDLVASANSFLVALIVGLSLRFQGLRTMLWATLGVALITLILKPIFVWLPSLVISLTPMQLEVLIIEAAMPSALLAVVLARRYGCDAELASKLVLVTSLGCVVSILVMSKLLWPT